MTDGRMLGPGILTDRWHIERIAHTKTNNLFNNGSIAEHATKEQTSPYTERYVWLPNEVYGANTLEHTNTIQLID